MEKYEAAGQDTLTRRYQHAPPFILSLVLLIVQEDVNPSDKVFVEGPEYEQYSASTKLRAGQN